MHHLATGDLTPLPAHNPYHWLGVALEALTVVAWIVIAIAYVADRFYGLDWLTFLGRIVRKRKAAPVYVHDCDGCTFLGTFNAPVPVWDEFLQSPITVTRTFDGYTHTHPGDVEYIARASDEGSDYLSTSRYTLTHVPEYLNRMHPALAVVVSRANG